MPLSIPSGELAVHDDVPLSSPSRMLDVQDRVSSPGLYAQDILNMIIADIRRLKG